MNLEDTNYVFFKERIKNDDKEAYKYILKLEECLKTEREMNNKILNKLEKYENAIREKFGVVSDE